MPIANAALRTFSFRVIVCLLCVMVFFPGRSVYGATQTVTSTSDSGAGSLRQAIIDAAAGDTIQFDSSLSGQTITLLTRLQLTKDLTIDGTTLPIVLTIDGNSSTQLFAVNAGVTATLSGFILANADAGFGGAIYNQGTLTVDRVTFIDNEALQGGAIYNVGPLTVLNSTFTGNSSFNGGALSNLAPATVRNSTLIGNSSFNPGGGIANADELALYNTIIAGSTDGGDCVNENNPQLGLQGTLTANVNNLIEDGSCEAAFTGDPGLAALNTVDGALVYAPQSGSSIIDAGDDATCTAIDQRGAVRPQGAACEIGAMEWITSHLNTDDQVIQDGFTATYNQTVTPCTTQPALSLPTHTITPTLRSNSSEHFGDLYFVVTELRYTTAQGSDLPTLCNADGGNGGGVGAKLTVALIGDLTDNVFAPAEAFTQPLNVGLPVRARYRIFLDLYGTPTTATAASADLPQPIGSFGWEFDEAGNLIDENWVDPAVRIFLPAIVR